MSLDFYLKGEERDVKCRCQECGTDHTYRRSTTLFSTNMTHNLIPMFAEAGAYEVLWEGDGMLASLVLPILQTSLETMKADPERFKKLDATNGWGRYVDALPWLERVVAACAEFPHARIKCSR